MLKQDFDRYPNLELEEVISTINNLKKESLDEIKKVLIYLPKIYDDSNILSTFFNDDDVLDLVFIYNNKSGYKIPITYQFEVFHKYYPLDVSWRNLIRYRAKGVSYQGIVGYFNYISCIPLLVSEFYSDSFDTEQTAIELLFNPKCKVSLEEFRPIEQLESKIIKAENSTLRHFV